MNNKAIIEFGFRRYEELCRSRRAFSTEAENTLLDLLNSSYPSQPHSIIANYFITLPFVIAPSLRNSCTFFIITSLLCWLWFSRYISLTDNVIGQLLIKVMVDVIV